MTTVKCYTLSTGHLEVLEAVESNTLNDALMAERARVLSDQDKSAEHVYYMDREG